MQNRTFYNEILTEHNLHPTHKHPLIQPSASLRGVNPSCGDDITLQLKMADDGSIEDGARYVHENDQREGVRGRIGIIRGGVSPSGHITYACQGKMCRFGMANPRTDP